MRHNQPRTMDYNVESTAFTQTFKIDFFIFLVAVMFSHTRWRNYNDQKSVATRCATLIAFDATARNARVIVCKRAECVLCEYGTCAHRFNWIASSREKSTVLISSIFSHITISFSTFKVIKDSLALVYFHLFNAQHMLYEPMCSWHSGVKINQCIVYTLVYLFKCSCCHCLLCVGCGVNVFNLLPNDVQACEITKNQKKKTQIFNFCNKIKVSTSNEK